MKKLILAMAALSFGAISMADTLPTIPLFTVAKAEMYKYAFPEATSKVDSPLNAKARSLDFSLTGDQWSGGGIGVDKQKIADYVAGGALEFYVRGGAGVEKVGVGFVQAKGMDAKKDLAFQILLPIANYASLSSAWTKVTIPLKDFPKQGSRWLADEKRSATGDFNWDRVSEFVISREPGSPAAVQVSFSNISIVGNYDASKVGAAKAKAASKAAKAKP